MVGAAGSTLSRVQAQQGAPAPSAPLDPGNPSTMPQPVITDDDFDEHESRAVAARPARRRRLWPLLASIGGVILLGGGLGWYFGNQWLDDQYFVGLRGEEVVIYRGVNTTIGPFELFDAVRSTTVPVTSLGPSERKQVTNGIPVANEDAGVKKVQELRTSSAASVGGDVSATPVPDASASPEPTKSKATATPKPTNS
nr:hypothetical protein GCM10020093_076780 [Planobispora longispora]